MLGAGGDTLTPPSIPPVQKSGTGQHHWEGEEVRTDHHPRLSYRGPRGRAGSAAVI